MPVSLSITLKTFKFLTLFVALVGTIDAGVSGSGLKAGRRTVSNNGSGSGLAPAQNILAVQVWFGFT